MKTFSEYESYDATGLAELVRKKEVTSGELVEAALARIEEQNSVLNAVVHLEPERARANTQNEGKFGGVPFLIKDLVSTVAGVPQTNGSAYFDAWTPDHNSELVNRWLGSGLNFLGKTNTPEFGLSPVTEPDANGITRNPWDLERTPGGSSGGAAAAVAAGFVPMASGGDGGGSIRIPASCCGLFGLKPTRGRTPMGPIAGESWQGCAIEHVLSRSVRDSALALDVTHGSDIGAPYAAPHFAGSFHSAASQDPRPLRIAFTTHSQLGATIHPDCIAAVEKTVDLLTDLGHEVEEASPTIHGPSFSRDYVMMLIGETAADIREAQITLQRKARYGSFEPATALLGLLGEEFSAVDFAMASRRLRRLHRQVGPFFEKYDLLLTPTLATPPVPIGTLMPHGLELFGIKSLVRLGAGALAKRAGAVDRIAENAWTFTPFTALFNVTGQPAASLPLHWNSDGVPIGCQLVAGFGNEEGLFQIAGQIERAQPWFDRRPPQRRQGDSNPT